MSSTDYDHGWEAEWDDMRRLGPCSRHHRRLVRQLVRRLPVRDVLDAGCGPGATLLDVAPLLPDARLHGVDFSPAAVRMARERIPTGTFDVLDLTKEALPAQFDLVLCLDVVEHLEDDAPAFAHVADMTRRWALFSTLQGRMRASEAAVGHVRNYELGDLLERVRRGGLRPVRVVEWGWPFYSPLYRNLLERVPHGSVSGEFGLAQKAAAAVLYGTFLLNSSRRGDYVFVLAERPGQEGQLPSGLPGRAVREASAG